MSVVSWQKMDRSSKPQTSPIPSKMRSVQPGNHCFLVVLTLEFLASLNAALPREIVPLGCAAVYGNDIYMSVLTLVKSLTILSKKAVELHTPSTNSISGVWCVGRLITHMDGVGCDFEEIAEEQSVFLSSHRSLRSVIETHSMYPDLVSRWTVDMTLPVFDKDGDVYADLWVKWQKLLDSLRASHCLLLVDDGSSNKCDLISSMYPHNV